MKKVLLTLIAAILVAIASFCIMSCDKSEDNSFTPTTSTLVGTWTLKSFTSDCISESTKITRTIVFDEVGHWIMTTKYNGMLQNEEGNIAVESGVVMFNFQYKIVQTSANKIEMISVPGQYTDCTETYYFEK